MKLWKCPLCYGETDNPEAHLRKMHHLNEFAIESYLKKGWWNDYPNLTKEMFEEAKK